MAKGTWKGQSEMRLERGYEKYITQGFGFWTLSQETENNERKYLIYIVERSIWMKNRLGGRGHSSENRRPVKRLLRITGKK